MAHAGQTKPDVPLIIVFATTGDGLDEWYGWLTRLTRAHSRQTLDRNEIARVDRDLREHLADEPQSERGEPDSRDTGSDKAAGGPIDRPVRTSDEESDTSVYAEGPTDEDRPYLPSGD